MKSIFFAAALIASSSAFAQYSASSSATATASGPNSFSSSFSSTQVRTGQVPTVTANTFSTGNAGASAFSQAVTAAGVKTATSFSFPTAASSFNAAVAPNASVHTFTNQAVTNQPVTANAPSIPTVSK